MTEKEKAIQKAFGEAWEKVKQCCDSAGFVERRVIAHGITNNMEPEKYGFQLSEIRRTLHSPDGYYKWRPVSLEGIEDNNGWIRSDERLPDDSNETILFCENGIPAGSERWKRGWEFRIMVKRHGSEVFTHWRPVEEVKPPIY